MIPVSVCVCLMCAQDLLAITLWETLLIIPTLALAL